VPSTFWLESENLRFGLWLECTTISLEANNDKILDILTANEKKLMSYKLICTLINKGKNNDPTNNLHGFQFLVFVFVFFCE
jgi:hypothetical protein